jgi:hypothetical protein
MQALVDFMARSVAEYPDDIVIREDAGESAVIYELDVHPDDREYICGGEYPLVRAMQQVLSAASGDRKAILELTGPDVEAVDDEDTSEE